MVVALLVAMLGLLIAPLPVAAYYHPDTGIIDSGSDRYNWWYFGDGQWKDVTTPFATDTEIYAYSDTMYRGTGYMAIWASFDSPQTITKTGAEGPWIMYWYKYYGALATLTVEQVAEEDVLDRLNADEVPAELRAGLVSPYVYRLYVRAFDHGYGAHMILHLTTPANYAIGHWEVDEPYPYSLYPPYSDWWRAGVCNLHQEVTNQPPVADAGPDQTAECTCCEGAEVILDGSGSSDLDKDSLTYSWFWSDGTASGVEPTVSLPLGTTTITLVVNDGTVDSDPDTVSITVEDITPPDITVSVTPATGPYYYTTDTVSITYTVSDICDASPTVDSITITNNGVMTGDITADSPISLSLATYAGDNVVTVTATDASGNTGTATVNINEVIFKLVGDQLFITPEALKVNPGVLTAHTDNWPAYYDPTTIQTAFCDGAEMDFLSDTGNMKFRRADVEAALAAEDQQIDTHFVITGTFIYNGATCDFIGSDDIKKIVTVTTAVKKGKGK